MIPYSIVINQKNGFRNVIGQNGEFAIVINSKRNFTGWINKGAKGDPGDNSGLTWNDTTVSVTMVADNAYKPDSSSLILFALPASSSLGDPISIRGYGIGGWTITQRSNEQIVIAGSISGQATTFGITGHLFSTNPNDGCDLISLGGGLWQAVTYGCDWD